MVTVEAAGSAQTTSAQPRRPRTGWVLAAAGVLVLGVVVRLLLVPPSAGGLPAAIMLVLLSLGMWAAAWLVSSERVAFISVVVVVCVVNLAALPPRPGPEYDERFAFYRTDQPITASVSASGAPRTPVLTVLAEPVSQSAQPRFGLAGTVGGAALEWTCPFQAGLQRLALPLPAEIVPANGELDLNLHLTGSPSRETDYLLVYASVQRPGLLFGLVDSQPARVDGDALRASMSAAHYQLASDRRPASSCWRARS